MLGTVITSRSAKKRNSNSENPSLGGDMLPTRLAPLSWTPEPPLSNTKAEHYIKQGEAFRKVSRSPRTSRFPAIRFIGMTANTHFTLRLQLEPKIENENHGAEPGARANDPICHVSCSEPHEPRQLGSWLIFNVRQKYKTHAQAIIPT